MSIQNCSECGRNVDTDWEELEDGLCINCLERYSTIIEREDTNQQ